MKKQSNFKLEEKTKDEIKFLSSTLDMSEAGVVEYAIKALMEKHKANPYKDTNEVYRFITDKTMEIENIRDYCEEQWSPEYEQLHTAMNKMLDMIRDLPTFWEPRYLDDNFQKLDEEHQKNKPF